MHKFLKMHGCGNSFVVVSDAATSTSFWKERAQRICSSSFGIGSDGLMLVQPSTDADYRVEMFNPDSSDMGMCGNGIRCVARALSEFNLHVASERPIVFDVQGRRISCTIERSSNDVVVDMGPPSFLPASLPITLQEPLIEGKISADGVDFRGTAVSMGNPHFVIFCGASRGALCDQYGAKLEHHPVFPKRVNVEFVEILAPDRIVVDVWERGAGRTLACGTGACASVVAGNVSGRLVESVSVTLPGGTVYVEWKGGEESVFLRGPAEVVCSGVFSSTFLESEGPSR